MLNAATKFAIGARLATSTQPVDFFRGGIDEVSVYGRALGALEVQALYAAGAQGKCGIQVPPAFATQPQSQSVLAGQAVQFAASVTGSSPLGFQWFVNGSALSGATGTALNLPAVGPSDMGAYVLVASNAFGVATSAVATLTISNIVCAGAPAGLAAWWPGNGTAGDAAGANNGTLFGGVAYAAGEVGQAFSLDGYSGCVVAPASPVLNPPASFSLEAWVYPWAKGVGRIVMGKWSNLGDYSEQRSYNMYLNPSNAVGFSISDAAHQEDVSFHTFEATAQPLPLAAWSHLVNVYDQSTGTRRIYINGVLAASRTDAPITVLNANTKFCIGARLATSTEPVDFFAGRIDEASVYTRALTSTEVLGLFQAGVQGKCPDQLSPFISLQPQSETAPLGASAQFSLAAGGQAPLAYQWWFNGAPVPGATGSSLSLTNVQSANAGNYSAVVSNPFGSLTSAVAVLTVTNNVVIPPACVPITNGLVSWWAGDGNANDSAGANNGVLVNHVAFAPGMVGQAFSFDGVGAHIEIPGSPQFNPTDSFSMEAWVYPQPQFVGRIIMGKWSEQGNYAGERSYDLYLDGNNCVGFGISDAANQQNGYFQDFVATSRPLTNNAWTHIVVVYLQSAGTRQIYLNGALAASRTDPPIHILSTTAKFAIGARMTTSTTSTDYFAGRIDEASFYNRSLSATEVMQLYSAGGLGKCQPMNPPLITSQPAGGNFASWTNATLAVSAAGSPPLGYQWSFNGALLAGATNSSLALTDLTSANAGKYAVLVTNPYGSVTSVDATVSVLPPPSLLQAGSVTATSAVVVLPVNLVALGTENGLGFSLDFDHTRLTFAGLNLGTGAGGASALFNTNAAPAGRLGVLLAMPGVTTFPAGTQEVAEISFFVNSGTNPATANITFGDLPSARQVSDAFANALPAAYVGGTVTIPWLGYEGDVAPLPNGDGAVTIIDWVQEGRYVAGLDTITNAAQFQRADTSPRAGYGDGQLTVADWVQTGRYAVGLDPLTVAGGPTAPANGPVSSKKSAAGSYGPLDLGRTILLAPTTAYPGKSVTVPVQLISQGNENAVGLSLKYDPTQLLATNVTLGAGDSAATLVANLNRASNGVVGFLLSLPFGTAFTAGTQEVARITYFVQPGAVSPAPLVFTNSPTASSVSDPLANALTTTFQGASLVVASLTPPTLQAIWTPTALTLAWPVNALGYTLQTSTNLGVGNWSVLSVAPVPGPVNQAVTLPIVAEPQRYYRLHHP